MRRIGNDVMLPDKHMPKAGGPAIRTIIGIFNAIMFISIDWPGVTMIRSPASAAMRPSSPDRGTRQVSRDRILTGETVPMPI